MAGSYDSDANDNNMVKVDDSVSSAPSSTDTVPSATYLGRRPVPIISSGYGLLLAIEEYKGDIPFTAELLRRSTFDFTNNQSVLVNDVLEAAEIESRYGFERQFVNAISALEESLDLRIEEEKAFFFKQKIRYTEIYEILRHSSFPFSANQAACLHRMLRAVYVVTGHPNSEADKEFMRSLGDLVKSLYMDDHLRDPTPYRVIVTDTIHFYLQGMVNQLDRLAKEEAERRLPDFLPPDSEIDLATYLVISLDTMIDRSKVLTPREHFHQGMVEIYMKLADIIRHSGLELSSRQDVAIQEVERRVQGLKREPLVEKHQEIVDACMEFMSELEENNPDREVTLDGNKVVWDTEGKVNRAVREIGWGLIYLQPAATEHLSNFPCFNYGVENAVVKVTDRFLSLYPMH